MSRNVSEILHLKLTLLDDEGDTTKPRLLTDSGLAKEPRPRPKLRAKEKKEARKKEKSVAVLCLLSHGLAEALLLQLG